MKLYFYFIFTVVLYSCADTTQQNAETQTSKESWQISNKIVLKHTYNNHGLLDTTYKTQEIYADGKVGMTLQFVTVRNYDANNKLTDEKTFHILNTNKLTETKSFSYDIRNNIVEEITKSNGIITSFIKRAYNNLNQEIKKIQITRVIDLDPNTNNIKKPSRYDTSIINTSYDDHGNVIKQLYSRSNEYSVVETIVTQYSGGKKLFSYGINSKGDTTSITKFEQSGTQLRSIREDKAYSFITDTSWYKGKSLTKHIIIDSKMNLRRMETYMYDEKGNVVENIFYK